ncbi:MAG: FIST signal transduction protein [Limisphaerales bacterium]
MQHDHAVTGHWPKPFNDDAMRDWAIGLRKQLRAPHVSLGMLFMTPDYFKDAEQILELLRVHAQIPLLIGCSSTSLIVDSAELEDKAGIVLALYALPDAKLRAVRFTQEQLEEASSPGYWQMETGITPEQVNGWLVFADPFHLDAETWLRSWNDSYAPKPILGGLASGDMNAQTTQIYLNGEVFEEGGIALAVGDDVELRSVISQGCTPIGQTWTITKAEANFIHEIGNRPAYQVLAETFETLPKADQQKARGNLFIGLVVDEYLEDFHRGDFLIRNILGGDPSSGSLAVGAFPRLGQTVQFQRRDATAASQDLHVLLERLKEQIGNHTVYGGCLCCCNGRGERLFGEPSHDASLIQEKVGPVQLAGFFCNGEIGPIGDKNFLHGYTAALALFTKKS